MELKEFVTQTLIQIIGGVKDAQELAAKERASINSERLYLESTGHIKYLDHVVSPIVTKIDFDVAVTTSEESKAQGGGVITIAAIAGIGSKLEAGSKDSTVCRIQFSVPVALPVQPHQE
jgi:hypothetical protein